MPRGDRHLRKKLNIKAEVRSRINSAGSSYTPQRTTYFGEDQYFRNNGIPHFTRSETGDRAEVRHVQLLLEGIRQDFLEYSPLRDAQLSRKLAQVHQALEGPVFQGESGNGYRAEYQVFVANYGQLLEQHKPNPSAIPKVTNPTALRMIEDSNAKRACAEQRARERFDRGRFWMGSY